MPHTIDRIHEASTTALGGNLPYRGLEWRAPSTPDYLIYVFNVSARKFTDVGRMRFTIPGVEDSDPSEVVVGSKTVPGKPNERYHFYSSFPQPILIPKFNDESGEIEPKETDVRRFIIDQISPDNLTLTLDTVIRPENAFAIGCDFSRRGIFFSYSNPPAQEDVRKAIDRMEAYYTELNQKAAAMELVDKAKLGVEVTSNPDYVFAARYFGKEFSFTEKTTRPSVCPNCGENRPQNAKFHQSSDGGLCVEPTVEAWKQVVRIGRRTEDQVPSEFKWKKEKEHTV